MSVVGNDVLGISGYGTVDKLVIVDILLYQTKMDVGFLELGSMQAGYGFHHIVGYLHSSLLGKNFLLLYQYLRVNAQGYVASHYTRPYLVIRTSRGQGLQEAVGVKYDSPHNGKGYACALCPTG